MTMGRAENAIDVVWDEILLMCEDDDGTAVRALGAFCLGSRTLSGFCWEERTVTEDDWVAAGEMAAHFLRAGRMREAFEDYLRRAEGALEAWEWREIEHELWSARFAEAAMFQDTWSPPSGWSDDY